MLPEKLFCSLRIGLICRKCGATAAAPQCEVNCAQHWFRQSYPLKSRQGNADKTSLTKKIFD